MQTAVNNPFAPIQDYGFVDKVYINDRQHIDLDKTIASFVAENAETLITASQCCIRWDKNLTRALNKLHDLAGMQFDPTVLDQSLDDEAIVADPLHEAASYETVGLVPMKYATAGLVIAELICTTG